MFRNLSRIFLLLLVFGIIAPAKAADLQVPKQFRSIQEAINAAVDGDRVMVAAGVYSGVDNVNLDFKGKNIAVIGVSGRLTSIIDCQGSARAVNFHGGESALALFKGFTVQNGSSNEGGAIRIEGASPTISNCSFRHCHAELGGALYVESGSPLIRVSEFTENTATNGGAAAVNGGSPSFVTVAFEENAAAGSGGGLFLTGGSTDIHRSRLFSNRATISGGGARESGGSLVIAETHVQENSAADGAGLSVAGLTSLLNCTVVVNHATGLYGGVSIDLGATVNIANSILSQNNPIQLAPGAKITSSYVDGGYGGQAVDQAPTFQDLSLLDAHLRWTSAVDAGTKPAITSEAVDLDGNSRIVGPAPDLGAFERSDNSANSPNTIVVTIPHDQDPKTDTYDLTLSGSATNVSGGPMSYQWTLDGSDVSDSTDLHISLKAGEYYFQFKATDSLGQFQTHATDVIVNPEPNSAPRVYAEIAGSKQGPGEATIVTLQGNVSDPDFDPVSVVWSDGSTDLTHDVELTPGTYDYTLTGTDPYGEVGTAHLQVYVAPNHGPNIYMKGSNPLIVEVDSQFVDPGATAFDADASESLPVTTEGAVDTAVIGNYSIKYSAVSASSLAASVHRTVIVRDTKPPVVTLNGSVNMVVGYGSAFSDPGASAVDAHAGPCQVYVSGSVDTYARGIYSVTYAATDPSGNTGFAVRKVKVALQTAPIVTLNGSDPMQVQVGTSFSDPGATAVSAAGDVLPVTATGTVDTITEGNYTVTYTATDADGNVGTATRTVQVVDHIPPVITVLGSNPLTAKVSLGAYTDAGATALDDVDGPVPVSASGTVDLQTVGTYTITYSATDAAGNTGTATRTVNVTKPDGPVITVTGSNPISIPGGSAYADAGATAVNALGNAVAVTTSSNVNTMALGTYTVTYTAVDQWGTTSIATRTVNVTTPTSAPVITLLGPNPIQLLESKDTYTEYGATAVDALGNTLTVTITGSVDTHKLGDYIMTYTATDQWGNTASVTRTVSVIPGSLTITVLGDNPMYVQWGTTFVDPGSTAVDSNGVSLTLKNEFGTVNTNAIGTYTLTYSYQDSHGNKASADRIVYVVNKVAPTITLLGSNPMSLTLGATFTDPGATAKDALGATVSVSASGTVNTAAAGSYTRTYSATDSYGNTATITRTVVVSNPTTPPTVTLIGGNPIVLKMGATFTDPGATAKDSLNNTLTVTASGSVNTSAAGSYTRSYSATDQWGNTGSATRTVKVYAPPVITLAGPNPQTIPHSNGTTWSDPGYSAVDSFGVSLTVTVTGGGFKEKVGTYTVTYTATDAAGNTTTVTRSVVCT